MSFSYSATNTFLKTHFRDLFDVTLKDASPFLSAMKKKKASAGGRTVNHTILYSNAGVVSAQLSSTITGYAASAGSVEAQLPWCRQYAYGEIDDLQLSLMKKSKDSYIEGVAKLQSQLIAGINQRLGAMAFSKGLGVLGETAAAGTYTAGSTSIVLKDKSMINNFAVGMYLTFTSDETGGTSAATTYITAIDKSAGGFTVASGTGIANDDYIWAPGDSPAAALAAVGDNKWAPGLQCWFPLPTAASTRSLVTGDAYLVGCTRTADTVGLAGAYYYGASDTSIEECLNSALHRGSRLGGNYNFIVMNPEQRGVFVSQLGSKVQYGFLPARGIDGPIADVGFDTVRIHGPDNVIDVVSDRFCPVNGMWAGNWEDIHLLSVNENLPELFDEDGNIILRKADSVNHSMMAKAYYTVAVDRPINFMSIVPPTLSL